MERKRRVSAELTIPSQGNLYRRLGGAARQRVCVGGVPGEEACAAAGEASRLA